MNYDSFYPTFCPTILAWERCPLSLRLGNAMLHKLAHPLVGTVSRLCSSDSQVLFRCPTPRDIQAGRVALAFTRRTAACFGCRCSRGLPVLGHEVSRCVWGLRLRRTGPRLALTPLVILPSANSRTSAY